MKTFIIFLLILLVLRWLLKPFIKFTVNTTINKMAEEAMRRQQQHSTAQKRSEGSIKVDYIPVNPKGQKPSKSPSSGDYIDYEEVK